MFELARDGHWDGELLVRRKDRSLFTAYVRNRLVLDADGSPSAVVGVALDVSARVAAETELLQSRDYARAVTECMGEGLFTLDVGGRVTYINRAAEKLLDWPAGELHGTRISDAIYAPRPDGSPRPFEQSPIARSLSREVTVRVEDDLFLACDGRELEVAYTATPFHTGDGLQGCVVIFQRNLGAKAAGGGASAGCGDARLHRPCREALAEDHFVLHAQPIVELERADRPARAAAADGRPRRQGRGARRVPVGRRAILPDRRHRPVGDQAGRAAGRPRLSREPNLSARSVGDLAFSSTSKGASSSVTSPPGCCVQITETAIVEDEAAARKFAERLHELGCKVALDDFGTGYGTLTYLKQIPVDYLKLDIEFVRDLRSNSASRHVVQAVVSMARDFQVQTVGEEVEDAQTLAAASQHGRGLRPGLSHGATHGVLGAPRRLEHARERPGAHAQARLRTHADACARGARTARVGDTRRPRAARCASRCREPMRAICVRLDFACLLLARAVLPERAGLLTDAWCRATLPFPSGYSSARAVSSSPAPVALGRRRRYPSFYWLPRIKELAKKKKLGGTTLETLVQVVTDGYFRQATSGRDDANLQPGPRRGR